MRTSTTKVLVMAASVIGLGGLADAAVVVQKVSFSGSQASVSFAGSASVTCADGSIGLVSAFGFLSGAQQIFSSTGQPTQMSNGIFVELDSYSNSCTNVFLGFAEGGIANGFTPPDTKLTSASLVGSTLVQDFSNGATIPFSVNITVLGTGQTNQSKANGHSKVTGSKGGPLTISHDHSANSNRSGTPTGTVTVGGVLLAPDFFFANLSINDNSSMTVSK